jgi:hypothetical protein
MDLNKNNILNTADIDTEDDDDTHKVCNVNDDNNDNNDDNNDNNNNDNNDNNNDNDNNDNNDNNNVNDNNNNDNVNIPTIPKSANMIAKFVLNNKVAKKAVTTYVENNPKKAANDMVKLYSIFNKHKKDKLSEEEINNKIKTTIYMINEMMPVFMKYMASHYPDDKQVNFELNNVVDIDGRKIKYHVIISE